MLSANPYNFSTADVISDGSFMPTSGSSNSETPKAVETPPIIPGRKTVFVDCVPPETTEEALRNEIDPFGERLSSKFSKDSHGYVRCAVVKFKSPQQATNFISCFNGRTWPGSQQTVKAQLTHQEERETDPERDRIFVTNLPTSARADDLTALFSQFGTVEEVDPFMAKDGSGMGSATVRFATIEQATAALEKVHNKVMFPEDGRRIFAKFWEPHGDRQKHKREQQMRQQQPVMSESGYGANAVQPSPMGVRWGGVPTMMPAYAPVPLQTFPTQAPIVCQNAAPMGHMMPPAFAVPAPPSMPATTQNPPVQLMTADDTDSSIVNINALRPQNGDIALYGTPITQSALVQILTLQYGPVMYCIPVSEITGGHAVRMQNVGLHQRISTELNGALLNNGSCLRSGIIKIV